MLEIARAEGVYIEDVTGKRYIDFISGIGVSNVGHRHPKVLEAMQQQMERYLHVMVYGEYIQSPQVQLAQAICKQLPDVLDMVYFVNSGAEATEGALKLAKRVTGRSRILAMEKAYHGSTHGALSVMGDAYFKTGYGPLLPGVSFLRWNHLSDLAHITPDVACVIAETIQGEAGALLPDPVWIRALRDRCTETGTLLILDEIQSGFGRTGSFFAFEAFGIVPDMVLMAKGMGGGLPIGAFAASRAHMLQLSHDPVLGHITTFGGNALTCAAALASMEVILSEHLMDRVPAMEQKIRASLNHPRILGISGKGLMLAVRLESNRAVLDVMNRCYERGLITDWFLFADNCIRVAPPLVISDSELDRALAILMQALDA
jgi:acetylornithine/succinyldiaminopimelate/putrescine aminotransferase